MRVEYRENNGIEFSIQQMYSTDNLEQKINKIRDLLIEKILGNEQSIAI